MDTREPAGWQWPDHVQSEVPNRGEESTDQSTQQEPASPPTDVPPQQQSSPRQRHWRPRTCRICLETVLPTLNTPSEHIPGIFQSTPSVTYISEDCGRLLRPCKCKGTAQFVHEGCLQAWRHADPGYARRNYFQCPTCQYRYRLQRLGWGRLISSVAAQITMTLSILMLTMFILGFMADPIIDFALDPYGTMIPFFGHSRRPVHLDILPDEGDGWIEHFTKGFASLGLLSFLKVLFASPMQFFFRSSGVGSRAGSNGRDRLSNMTWLLIMIGVATFLYTIWKGVRAWSRRALEKAGERVMDVQVDDDDDDDKENDQEERPPT